MVVKTLKYECDCCGELAFMPEDSKEAPQGWRSNTEVGDLCPTCCNSWEQFKESFKQRMRK